MLVGREQEQRELLTLLEKDESQFCAVYGRRRVGKTYLVRETFANRFAFQHTGLSNASKNDQLREFRESLRTAGMRTAKIPASWYEAFTMLQQHLESLPKGKKVVFIDELSWMDTPKSNFVSALEHFWNGWATARKEKDIVLIVCGSATSWITSKIINSHGGLHNRLTRQIYLQPFTLHECREYARGQRLDMSDRDVMEAYMVLGGVPYYWSFMRRGESLAQNIDRLFFAPAAPLANEYKALYASIFRNPEPHIKIIEKLASNKSGLTRKKLLASTGLNDNAIFNRAVEELQQCGFVRRYEAFGKRERDVVYQLMDSFTLFYFHFMLKNRRHDKRYWSHSVDTSRHDSWAGQAFERVCLWHLPQLLRALGISGVVTSAHSWWTEATDDHDGAQIDLLIDRNDGIVNLCEMKYVETEYAINKSEDAKLRRRKAIFKQVTKTRKSVHITMVTTYGLKHNAYSSDVQSEVTMKDLFRF